MLKHQYSWLLTEQPQRQQWLKCLYLTSEFILITFLSFFMIMTMSTRRVRPVGRGCLRLLITWSLLYHLLYLYHRDSCLLCFEFVFRYMNFWDDLQLVIVIFLLGLTNLIKDLVNVALSSDVVKRLLVCFLI